jgi:hypothetical protein
MQMHLVRALRAVSCAGVLVASPWDAGSAQTQAGAPAPGSALLASASGEVAGDTVRITGTADGQLFVRLLGATGAMLLIDPAAGTEFVASVRSYLGKVRAAGACQADDTAIPRLAAARAHRSGIDGIAVRCGAAATPGGAMPFTVLATRKSDGPPLEALALVTGGTAVEGFALDLERLIAGRRR